MRPKLLPFVINMLGSFSRSKFYTQRQSIATPHSVHALPHSNSSTFYHAKRRESYDPQFRDKEREIYEQQVSFERELENER